VRNTGTGTNTVVWSQETYSLDPGDNYYFGTVSYAKNSSEIVFGVYHSTGPHSDTLTAYLWPGSGDPQPLALNSLFTEPVISPDGEFLLYGTPNRAYTSNRPFTKIALYDITTGQQYWVSVDRFGQASDDSPNGDCLGGVFSGDGKYVAFESTADDIVANDTNLAVDAFVRPLANVLSGRPTSTARVSG
jgi:hypothetical protein